MHQSEKITISYLHNIRIGIAILAQNCLGCQNSKFMPNLTMAPEQPSVENCHTSINVSLWIQRTDHSILGGKLIHLGYRRRILKLCSSHKSSASRSHNSFNNDKNTGRTPSKYSKDTGLISFFYDTQSTNTNTVPPCCIKKTH